MQFKKREREAMYVQCKTEAPSRKHCCRRKAINVKYSECVSVALVIQHAKRMRRIKQSRGLSGSTFVHIIS
jgi:hypothetical protein